MELFFFILTGDASGFIKFCWFCVNREVSRPPHLRQDRLEAYPTSRSKIPGAYRI
jgi:hypothetical protein